MIFDVLTCDVPSNNTNRIYPLSEMAPAVERYNKLIENRSAVGTIGIESFAGATDSDVIIQMIEDPSVVSYEIDLARVSHLVTSMYIEDGKVKATIKVLDTPHGKILQQLIDDKCVRLTFIIKGKIDSNMMVSNMSICHTIFLPCVDILSKSFLPTTKQHDLFKDIHYADQIHNRTH